MTGYQNAAVARVTKAKLLQAFWAAGRLKEQTSHEVAASLVCATVAELTEAGHDLPDHASVEINAIADAFALDSSIRTLWGEPGLQKQVLKALADGANVEEALGALAPEYLLDLSTYLHPHDAEWVLNPTGEPIDVIARVRCAAAKVRYNYKPRRGRRTDVALETAVRALIKVLEPVLGGKLRISNNKSKAGRGPTPNCAGTRVIVRLLNGIDSRNATSTAILNMVELVKRQPEPVEDHLLELMRANPIMVLDASLLPDREGEIRRIRDNPNYGFA